MKKSYAAIGKIRFCSIIKQLGVLIIYLCCLLVSTGYAQGELVNFNIPVIEGGKALEMFAEQANVSLIYSSKETNNVQTKEVIGQYAVERALSKLLDGTGLGFVHTGGSTISVNKDHHQAQVEPPSKADESKDSPKKVAPISAASEADNADKAAQSDKEVKPKLQKGESESHDDYILEDTVVTATKTGETDLQKTALTITAFSGELIDDTNSIDLSSLSQYVPNTHVTVTGNGGIIAYIRGVGNEGAFDVFGEQNVGMYVDGVYMDRGYGANITFFDLERIEVLRGPQGTLWGRNTTGGAINIITNRPSNELEVKVGLEVGNYDQQRVDAVISGPIVKDKLKARLSFSDNAHDGYLENVAGGPDLFALDSTSFRGVIEFTPIERLEILFRGDYFEQDCQKSSIRLIDDTGFFYQIPIAMGLHREQVITRDFWGTATGDPDGGRTDEEYWGLSAAINFDVSDRLTLRSITAYREWEKFDIQDLDGGPISLLRVSEPKMVEYFTQEIQLDGSWNRWTWGLGAYYFNFSIEDPSVVVDMDFIAPGFALNISALGDTTAWAAFGNVSYALTDELTVVAGIRYSYEEKWFNQVNYTVPVPFMPPISKSAEESWDHVSPKFGISYQIGKESLLYGSISNGWKSGLFSPGNPPGSEKLDEETLWSYEVGAKCDWFENRLRTNIAAFYYDYTDMQQRTQTVQGGIFSNAASAEIYGLEMELTARPIPPLVFNCSVSFLDTSYENFITLDPDSNLVDVSGNVMPHAPDWKIVLGAQHVLKVADLGFLTVRGDLTWTDDQYHDQFNIGIRQQESFALIDALLQFETSGGNWQFELYGKNLSEEEYLTTSFTMPGGVLGYVGTPRIYGFQVVYNY
ncbi:MAG: TonB-dependent receptor [Deltaproteobacteria bacterium]|nr:TonB-dependent receptor [Deltaproteobacteria bacterium]